ncbi:MAG TPA: isochorismatase family protein [Candidatus Acidoferrales bacterium]|nr:isochorismatase family protein [Candidatus Acidoferrales bacterium]
MKKLASFAFVIALSACTATPAASPAPTTAPTVAAATPTPTPAPTATSPIPVIPAPVAVEVPVAGAALLVLDITNTICDVRPSCVASVPKIAILVKKARDAKVPVIYSTTTTAGTLVRPEITPQSGDITIAGRADKFFGTNLEQILKDKNVQNAVVVGSASNGAVLYTVFGLNLRGITVVVAQDGISAEPEFPTTVTRWQLLNEPGFTNADNKPLAKGFVTLSTTDLVTFK